MRDVFPDDENDPFDLDDFEYYDEESEPDPEDDD
jgi:hypothetical protein